jgi:hypothetical protein
MTDNLALTQGEMDYGSGYACYKIDRKGTTPLINWPYIQGFCSALADDVGHDYDSIHAALIDFFGSDHADALLQITTEQLNTDQPWYRWPSLPTQ